MADTSTRDARLRALGRCVGHLADAIREFRASGQRVEDWPELCALVWRQQTDEQHTEAPAE